MDDKTIEAYNAQVERYTKLVSRVKPDKDLKAFMAKLPENAEVLDLGAGPGNSTKIMQDHGINAVAWDASPDMVQAAKDVFGIAAELKTFEDLVAVAAFDGIWANFSLLHVQREILPRHINRVHTALKPTGVFHLGMKLGRGEERDRFGRFYCYHSESELTDMLKAAGFSDISVRCGEMEGMAGDVEPFAIILAHA